MYFLEVVINEENLFFKNIQIWNCMISYKQCKIINICVPRINQYTGISWTLKLLWSYIGFTGWAKTLFGVYSGRLNSSIYLHITRYTVCSLRSIGGKLFTFLCTSVHQIYDGNNAQTYIDSVYKNVSHFVADIPPENIEIHEINYYD